MYKKNAWNLDQWTWWRYCNFLLEQLAIMNILTSKHFLKYDNNSWVNHMRNSFQVRLCWRVVWHHVLLRSRSRFRILFQVMTGYKFIQGCLLVFVFVWMDLFSCKKKNVLVANPNLLVGIIFCWALLCTLFWAPCNWFIQRFYAIWGPSSAWYFAISRLLLQSC